MVDSQEMKDDVTVQVRLDDAISKIQRRQFVEALHGLIPLVGADSASVRLLASRRIAEVALQLGHFATSAGWAAHCAALARRVNDAKMLAVAFGVLSESLLRGGLASSAYEMATLDLELLPPESKERPRVLCLQALALARMGKETAGAAEFAYRTAANSYGSDAKDFSVAGLALLAADTGNQTLMNSLESEFPRIRSPIALFRIYLAKSRLLAQQNTVPTTELQLADKALSISYPAERIWFQLYARSLGFEQPESGSIASLKAAALPAPWDHPDWEQVSELEWNDRFGRLYDQGFANMEWASQNPEGLWRQRQYFLL